MKRYKAVDFRYDDLDGTGTALDIIECQDGEFVKVDDINNENLWKTIPCPSCLGTGSIRDNNDRQLVCPTCCGRDVVYIQWRIQ